MTAQSTLISDASFVHTQVSLFPKTDGTYNAVVTASITAEVHRSTRLTLSVVADGKVMAEQTVEDGTHEYVLNITEVKIVDSIMLAIDGVQESSDVFLFDPLNGYSASQSMAGYNDSALPVHAERTVVPEIIRETEAETTPEETTEESESETISEAPNTGDALIVSGIIWTVTEVLAGTGIGLILGLKRNRNGAGK